MEKLCPACNVRLVEGYWDTVEEEQDGSLLFDCFEALVCAKRCGYYIRIERLT